MKNAYKKLLFLLVVTIVYFFISWDFVGMPYIMHNSARHEWVNYRNKTVYHTKLFGDIPIANIGGKDYESNGPVYYTDWAPVDGHM